MLSEFFEKYFIEPITNPAVQGYNLVNTTVYASILLAVAFFIVLPLLRKLKVKLDYKFALALLPYILFGVSLRVINTFELIPFIRKTPNPLEPGFWTFTPGVWLLTFSVTILALFFSKKLFPKSWLKVFCLVGIIIMLPFLLLCVINFTNLFAFLLALFSILFCIVLSKLILEHFTSLLSEPMNLLVYSGQAIDSIASVIAITFFSFREQHPLSAFIIDINPMLFIILKLSFALLILWFLETELENKRIKERELSNFIKLLLYILGFSTGLASMLKLGFATFL